MVEGHADHSSVTEGVGCHLEAKQQPSLEINILFNQHNVLCFYSIIRHNSECFSGRFRDNGAKKLVLTR